MKILKYLIFAFWSTLLFSQCKNAKTANDSSSTYQKVALDFLGEGYTSEANATRSMMLCSIVTQLPKHAGVGVKFLVYDQDNQTVVYKDSIDKGTVSWFSDTELALFYTPGMMRVQQTRDDYTFIYNLNTQERVKKSAIK